MSCAPAPADSRPGRDIYDCQRPAAESGSNLNLTVVTRAVTPASVGLSGPRACQPSARQGLRLAQFMLGPTRRPRPVTRLD